MNLEKKGSYYLIGIVLSLGSFFFLDEPLALLCKNVATRHGGLRLLVGNIPDLLLPLTAGVAALAWIIYFGIRVVKGHERILFFLRTLGLALPVALILKSASKFLVGRISTRSWLLDPAAPRFQWFNGQGCHTGFPSGHMTVFAVLVAALCAFDPRRRRFYLAALALLGFCLVVTTYHFLSDVLAGACLGFLIHDGVARGRGGIPVPATEQWLAEAFAEGRITKSNFPFSISESNSR